jgi:hypothetical protein
MIICNLDRNLDSNDGYILCLIVLVDGEPDGKKPIFH